MEKQTHQGSSCIITAQGLSYIERPGEKEGEVIQIPVDLAQLACRRRGLASLSLGGAQSEKEIRLMRQVFGMK